MWTDRVAARREILTTSAVSAQVQEGPAHDYDKMLRLIAQMEEKGEDSEQAQIEAFYAMKAQRGGRVPWANRQDLWKLRGRPV